MADLQRQIGDRARETAARTAAVGDVIQPGEAIPDNVVALEDKDGDPWHRSTRADYPWGSAPGIGGFTSGGLEAWGPLTVTAVREQPAASLPTRRLRECVERWPDAETGGYDPRCCRFPKSCSATVYNEGAVADEDLEPAEPEQQHPAPSGLCQVGDDRVTCIVTDPAHRRIYHDGRGMDDVAQTLLAAGPQQADERHCGNEHYVHGPHVWRELNDDGDGVVRGRCPGTGPTARPQQPCPDAAPHDAHEHRGFADPPWVRASQCPGVPVPQQPLVDRLEAEAEHVTDELVRVRAERDEWRSKAQHMAVELAATEQMLAVATQQPDPLVLRLPEVPEGTVVLVTEDGDRFVVHGDQGGHSWWHNNRRGTMSLARLLSEVGPMRVELAPPREPRTDLPCGHPIESSKFEDHDGARVLITVPAASDSNGDNITTPLAWCAQGHGWVSLTADEFAELTEVLDEPGGAR